MIGPVEPQQSLDDFAGFAARVGAVDDSRAHRYSTPVVRELTPQDMDRQRGLVARSLLAPRRSSDGLDGRQRHGF
jgi:hypothetical protein